MVESKFILVNISIILNLLIINEIFYSEGASVIKQPRYNEVKCHEYQSAVFQSGDTSNEKCNFNTNEATDKDTDVNLIEFPHLALIGYDQNGDDTISFKCVGALISDRYVLLTAHCISSYIKKVRVGGIRESDTNKEDINVEKFIIHPNFYTREHTNDIALLKLEKGIKIDQFKRPACLPSDPNWSQLYAFETYIIKVDSQVFIEKLKVFRNSENGCKEFFSEVTSRVNISYDLQICAGSEIRTPSQTTGGPLQIYHPNEFCMYEIVGLDSFSLTKFNVIVDVYTRVNSYIDWIESIVWA